MWKDGDGHLWEVSQALGAGAYGLHRSLLAAPGKTHLVLLVCICRQSCVQGPNLAFRWLREKVALAPFVLE